MKDNTTTTMPDLTDSLPLCAVFSLSDLKVGDRVKMQFAHRYRREFGWDIFSDSDYIVTEIHEKYVQLISCKYGHEGHKLFNVGGKNTREWLVGKYGA